MKTSPSISALWVLGCSLLAVGCTLDSSATARSGKGPWDGDSHADGSVARPDSGVNVAPDAGEEDGGFAADAQVEPDADVTADAGIVSGGDAGASTSDAGAADAGAPLPCPSTDPNLVACYPFNGDARDHSMYSDHTHISAITYVVGPAGDAVSRQLTSLIGVDPAPNLDLQRFTLEAWVKLRTFPTSGRVVVLDKEGEYTMFINSNRRPVCRLPMGDAPAGNTVPIGQWMHLACTYDGAQLRLFQNGTPTTTVAMSGAIPVTTLGMRFGEDAVTAGGDAMDGFLDNVRIWRLVRTGAQICAAAGSACTTAQP